MKYLVLAISAAFAILLASTAFSQSVPTDPIPELPLIKGTINVMDVNGATYAFDSKVLFYTVEECMLRGNEALRQIMDMSVIQAMYITCEPNGEDV